jgi:hypothetical protein
LSLRSLGRGDGNACFPELSSTWKAFSVQMLMFFLADFCQKVSMDTGRLKLVAVHMWGMADFTWVLTHSGIEMQPHERERAVYAGRIYLLTLQALCGIAKANSEFMWRTRPKNHYFAHILIMLAKSPLNPKLFNCLRRESMLGKLKKIGKSCSKLTVTKVVLQKYLVAQTGRIKVRQRCGKFKISPSDRLRWKRPSDSRMDKFTDFMHKLASRIQ